MARMSLLGWDGMGYTATESVKSEFGGETD